MSNCGSRYTNDTGLHGDTFFAGSGHFQVNEIDILGIFEITDQTSVPPDRACALFLNCF
jgi:hypothetical protein